MIISLLNCSMSGAIATAKDRSNIIPEYTTGQKSINNIDFYLKLIYNR